MKYFIYLIVFTFGIAVVHAQVFIIHNGYAEFRAEATFNDYKGISNDLDGAINFDDNSVSFRIPIESLDTGIKKRNRDMHELLETDKYPYASFEGEIVSDFNPELESPQKITVSGIFTLSGVERPLEITGTINRSGNELHVKAEWEHYITNFNIKPPRFLINKVKDRHIIMIKAVLIRRE